MYTCVQSQTTILGLSLIPPGAHFVGPQAFNGITRMHTADTVEAV